MPATRLTRGAVHEAGHVAVAYALGRRVTFIRMGRQVVPANHPHVELLQGSVTDGESRFGPALATEINNRVNTGTPLEADHVEWLRAELVTCFGGVLAETTLLGEMDQEGAAADLKQASITIQLLGIRADADGGEARLERAQEVAQRVISELTASLEQVATVLSKGPCEFDESSAHRLLEQSGVRPGTHRRLLDELASEHADDP